VSRPYFRWIRDIEKFYVAVFFCGFASLREILFAFDRALPQQKFHAKARRRKEGRKEEKPKEPNLTSIRVIRGRSLPNIPRERGATNETNPV
jgi:hypothetical protein